jgi:Domain of unknown function (DUF1906)
MGVEQMTKIIDTANDTTHVLPQLKAAGVETIIRYITRSTNSEKCIHPSEAKAIAGVGLKLGLVFEEWGGSSNFSHRDIDASSGTQHGLFAKNWAANVGAPDGTIIWFAIDNDVSQDQFARLVRPYFMSVKAALGGKYRTGIYGCAFACEQCLDSGLADAGWLSNAMGWNGSKNFRAGNRWHLLQHSDTHLCGLDIDPNDASENDYGAFVPFQQVAPIKPPTITMPQLNLLNLSELEVIKQHIESLIKQGRAGPLTLPTNMNLAQLANINKQLEVFVQLASTILPILSMFVPQLKILIPILPVLAGLLKMGDDIAQGGNDPAKIADVLAAHLKNVAQQVQALKLPGQS